MCTWLEYKELSSLSFSTCTMPLRWPALLVWAHSCVPQRAQVSLPCLVKTWVILSKETAWENRQCPCVWKCFLLTGQSWVHAATAKLILLQKFCVYIFCICFLGGVFGQSVICSAFPNVCAIILNRNWRAKSTLNYVTVDSFHACLFIPRNVMCLCKFVFRRF